MNLPLTACLTKSDELAKEKGCYFDPKAAQRVINFAEKFCRPSQGDGAGRLVELAPWQRTLIERLYGEKKPDGKRRFNRLSLWVPRRNGKSFLMSILAIHGLCADKENGPHICICANTIDQASVIYEECCKIVSQSPELNKLLWLRPHIKTIEYKTKNGKLQVISADKRGRMGRNYSQIYWDEIADYGIYKHEIFTALEHSQENRSQPLFCMLSSAGHNRFDIGYEQYQLAKDLLSGSKVNTSILPIVYEASPDDPWDSLETAKKSNPSYNIHIAPEKFQEAIDRAKLNPRLINEYRIYRTGVWCESFEQFIPTEIWRNCLENFNETDLLGKPCFVGVDSARRYDLAVIAYLFQVDEKVYVLPRFFLPEDIAKQQTEVPYTTWQKQGYMTLTPGDIITEDQIKNQILKDSKKFKIRAVYYDPNLVQNCMDDLRHNYAIETVEVHQSMTGQSPATFYFEELCHKGRLRHNGNPVMDYCLNNTSVRRRGEMIQVDKYKGKRNDGVCAIIQGLVGVMTQPAKLPKLYIGLA